MTTDSYAPKLFDLDDDVRGLVRKSDPETSVAAATKAKSKSEAHRELALRILRQHAAGLTDFELGSISGVQQASIGVRRGELVRKGLVEYAGFTRPFSLWLACSGLEGSAVNTHGFVAIPGDPYWCQICGREVQSRAHRDAPPPPNVRVQFVGSIADLVIGQHVLIDSEEYVVVQCLEEAA